MLALVAFRLTRLVGWDDISARMRAWLGISDATYASKIEEIEEEEAAGRNPFWGRRDHARWYIARLIRCPWCAGFWVSLLVAVGAALAGLADWGWVIPFGLALSAVVGLVAKWLDP